MASFCVEQGRWRQRGFESLEFFAASRAVVPTKELKLAIKDKKGQREVWNQARAAQTEMATGLGAASGTASGGGISSAGARPMLADRASPTSLMLALEDKKLGEAVEKYVAGLGRIVHGKADVTGYAFAINGQLNSADVYSSPALFGALWPKLLRASAVEAVSKYRKDGKFAPVAAESVTVMLRDAEGGSEAAQDVAGNVRLVRKETEKNLLFESRDGDGWVHRNYTVK